MKILSLGILLALPFMSLATIWEVGPAKLYTKPSQVASLVNDFDTVYIQAGEYKRDVCIWRAHNLYLSGVGGKAHLNAEKTAYGGKAIWVVAGNNTYIENIEFSNCEVVDRNGAGIRLEGTNLRLRSCFFHHNQNGILAGDNPSSEIVIEHSEFAYNGAGDGYSHNLYINHVKSLVFQYNYTHHPYYGHAIKSRAYTNVILYNRITDEDGDASYEIDLPNGGPSLIMGNIIQQSKFGENNSILSYAREGMSNPGPHNLFFIHNTVVNNKDRGIALNVQSNIDTLFSSNNLFAGQMATLSGNPTTYIQLSNIISDNLDYFKFISTENYDYHLSKNSPGIDSAIKMNRLFLTYTLIPDKEYAHPLSWKPRVSDANPDIGSYELQQITASDELSILDEPGYYDNQGKLFILNKNYFKAIEAKLSFELYNIQGKLIMNHKPVQFLPVDLNGIPPGLYIYKLRSVRNNSTGTLVVTH